MIVLPEKEREKLKKLIELHKEQVEKMKKEDLDNF